MAGSGYPYNLMEDRIILHYILDGGYQHVVKGNVVWKKMEEENILPGRTWHSLKNRFKRTIIQDCGRPEYGLTKEQKDTLQPPENPTVKRQVDRRLIKYNQEKKAHRQKKKENLSKPTGSDKSKDEAGVQEVARTKSLQTHVKRTTKKKNPVRKKSPEKKEFYSLDMEWSDSD